MAGEGDGAAALADVLEGVAVGAGAVVTRDIASNQTWTGIPAAPKVP
jgi:acetyltransferase-like isoleucine patch superfamily enzyme